MFLWDWSSNRRVSLTTTPQLPIFQKAYPGAGGILSVLCSFVLNSVHTPFLSQSRTVCFPSMFTKEGLALRASRCDHWLNNSLCQPLCFVSLYLPLDSFFGSGSRSPRWFITMLRVDMRVLFWEIPRMGLSRISYIITCAGTQCVWASL